MRSLKTQIILTILVCTIMAIAITGGRSIISSYNTIKSDSMHNMELICESSSNEIDEILRNISQSVDTFKSVAVNYLDDLEKFQNDINYATKYTDKLDKIILKFAENTDGAMTAYIRYNPELINSVSGIFYTKNNVNDTNFVKTELTDLSLYDKDDIEHVGWYYIPIENGKPTWMEPYYNANLDITMISYVIPVFIDDITIGVIGMDIDFSIIQDIIDKVLVYDTGYSFLLSEKDNIIYHKSIELNTDISKIENADLSSAIEKLNNIEYENEPIKYTYNNEKKSMYYNVLINGSKFVLSALDSEISKASLDIVKSISKSSIFALIFSIVIGFLISTMITIPLKRIKVIVNDTADFNFLHNEHSDKLCKMKNEIGDISRALRKMRSELRNMVGKINITGINITDTINSLNEITQVVDNMCTNNASTTEQLAASMQETSSTTDNINSNIISVKNEADNIKDLSATGTNSSKEVQNRANNLKVSTEKSSNYTKEIYNSVKEKSTEAIEKSKAVAKVNELTNAIMEISSQTSLLALNASIEAARAGEAGKGFSVVANEIGNLANQTSHTVENINNIVEEINTAVSDMATCLDNATMFLEKKVLVDYNNFMDVSNKYAQDATLFENIMVNVNQAISSLSNSIDDISGDVSGINVTVDEASGSIMQISEGSTEMMLKTQKVNTLVNDSKENINELKNMVNMFKLS